MLLLLAPPGPPFEMLERAQEIYWQAIAHGEARPAWRELGRALGFAPAALRERMGGPAPPPAGEETR